LLHRNKDTSFISIVIPTYNSGKYIASTLESVFSQTYSNYEVIVCDDGSSDNTCQIVRGLFNVFPEKITRLMTNPHSGPGAARNSGIIAAKGEWISFLDSDDRWFNTKLEKIAEYISNNETAYLICHSEIWRRGNAETVLKYSKCFNYDLHPFISLYKQNALSTSAVTVKKKYLIEAGLFDTTLPSAQDYDLWLRFSLIPDIKIRFIDEPLGFYVTRDGNISSDVEQRLRCMLKIGRKYLVNLKEISKFPTIERLKFEGKIYALGGITLLRRGNFIKGIAFFVIGIVKWPFRFDWVCKLVKKLLQIKSCQA
jgi:glycosyltransferase involved in cell wall biosynthesis